MTTSIDYLIVGQGLAGSLLAWELLQAGKSVQVIDQGGSQASLLAGLFNPLAGARHKVAWQADRLFGLLTTYYPALDQALGQRTYFPLPLVKPFLTARQQAQWKQRPWTPYATYHSVLPAPYLSTSYGGLWVSPAGYVQVGELLAALRAFFKAQKSYLRARFSYEALDVSPEGVRYRHWAAKKIIFCQGAGVHDNPFFKGLPWLFIQGERLGLHLPTPLTFAYSQGVYLVALGHQAFLGGTYVPHPDLTAPPTPTWQGATWLQERLARYWRLPYELVHAQAAVRVKTSHRKPLVGSHPDYPACYVCNGMGSKGVSLAPYLARLLAAHLLQGHPIPLELRGPSQETLLEGGSPISS